MDYCDIEAHNVRTWSENSDSADVYAQVVYYVRPDCNSVEFEFIHEMIFNYSSRSWQIDAVRKK